MAQITMSDMLKAGLHFGHQTRRWNPKMRPYIFGARNGIHIIDLQQTVKLFRVAYDKVVDTVANGGKVLFIGCGTRPNTSMHAVEELSRPPYLFGPPVRYQMTDVAGRTYTAICVSHGFAGVSQRYERLVPLLPAGGYAAANVHTAFCELIDAAEMWRTADERYRADPLYFVDTAE